MANALDDGGPPQGNDPLVVLLPLLIVLSTLLFLLLLFLVFILLLRRRRSIVLRDNDGPIDLSREEFISADGGFEAIEARWLEAASEQERQMYRRAQAFQTQYPPNSLPTDITLSQFLSIQEKGVSAWSFDPDYESSPNVLVHARTELTFLPDPSSASSVQSNLPLPKLNEVYYWEVKMFDLPIGTNVSIGLATKPYPSFQLPGHNRHSIAYHSNGDKSYNYPFTISSYGSPLKEGDVLGVGYKPRTGSVFFTRNGRKLDDAFTGLSRWNLFPTIGADGPCSVHVNLGQAGFVHIEANVKKWGLAPSVGTLAPPPAYGSERGSILLEAGGDPRIAGRPILSGGTAGAATASDRTRRPTTDPLPPRAGSSASTMSSPQPRRSSNRSSRRPRHPAVLSSALSSSVPVTPSPLRGGVTSPTPDDDEEDITPRTTRAPSDRYISPTDTPFHQPSLDPRLPPATPSDDESDRSSLIGEDETEEAPLVRSETTVDLDEEDAMARSDDTVVGLGAPDSPQIPNPPTPHLTDIRLRTLHTTPRSRGSSVSNSNGAGPSAIPSHARIGSSHSRSRSTPTAHLRQPPTDDTAPPAYSPLNPHTYPDGVAIDLPADVIAAALEGPTPAERATAASRRPLS
ncbi:Rsp5p-dependent ubiquitination, sorting of cargo proteins at the multivesicular body [Tulasnella sp. 330]|nr:Rsp5p-dependent ubiquitination, sorting of cargo proteins at the multivesicular body [Tulasnella sp. 330]KAG8883710.1 Rsp5p-dependent ubiquitination, sorting of cargo proteins at the multivesicular body [Tulasnella sp. 331]KAG8889057.1 Rsp5p-dependent ubiquitination, sorting of cargo proteins at the multivesicular body [Tulasnella sp. 332]